ncbi:MULTISPECIES: Nif3-like dinuclear metal center hexameric protein [unclassified Frondihabitans]|uniref:Nif3-like dinuclear metal center hexameric protein n=1 Tax=unclassified Frondihabitans TaxID=2626248 RepID=UPI000F50F667|nr:MULTISPECIES: Nif3-like dinuclear metal center hexameric protein [unclassified Frondihabitans]RPE75219.1 dinuclear metal center YbgI/SA1388 family protein [Frondihabitans sp. PhB153]RPF04461.1 dinuclear metal center YbgI/SA1388 family protein [Frondihabitans sp. PhB161]
MVTLEAVGAAVEALWPLSGASGWDSPGLVSGDPTATVGRIHLAVDAVLDTADEALEVGADLLLVHHPLLFHGVTSVAESTTKGAVLARLIRGSCALLSAHTNADVVETGTSRAIAARLGLVDQAPLETSSGESTGTTGLGIVGRLPQPVTLVALARALADILPSVAGGVRVAGASDRVIQTVALCGGAGDSLLDNPSVVGADVYITSDLRHHPASDARDRMLLGQGPALVDVSHWASEWLWLDTAAAELRAALPGVEVSVSELRTDPWDFAVLQ